VDEPNGAEAAATEPGATTPAPTEPVAPPVVAISPSASAPGGSAFRWIATAAISGALVTAASVAMGNVGGAAARWSGALAAAGLGLSVGAIVGILESVVAPRLAPRWTRVVARIAPYVDRSADAPREKVVALHAHALLALLVAVVTAAVTKLALVRLRTVQNVDLQEGLTVAAVVFALFAGLALAALLRGVALRGVARIDARVRLPLPGSPSLRRALWIGAPLVVGGAGGVALLGKALGPFVAPFALAALLGLQIALWSIVAGRPVTPGRARAALLAVVAIAAGIGGAHGAIRALSQSAGAVDRAPWAAALLAGARNATDLDRDGTSSLLGGGDCAPFDGRRRPGVVDVPQNGIDEDCSGADTDAALAMPTGPRVLGGRKIEGRKPDIVWFVVDAVRADHVGFLGYDRETTPNLDKLAADSIVFEHALSQSSATMLSFPSFLTGLDPGRMTWRIERDRLQVGANQPFVASRLEALGYRTGFVAAEYFTKRLPGLLEGWSWMHVSEAKQTTSSPSAAAHAAQFVGEARASDQPFFLVVYMAGPHSPYVSHGPAYPSFGKKQIDLYDQEIVAADRNIGFVLELLRSDTKRWKNTIVVFNSDHGEEFGEHGGTDHARTCHAESVRVPLVVRIPGESPARVEGPVGLIDVVPTLIELTGGTVRQDEVDGHSLLLARHDPQKLPSDRPFFCSVVSQKATQGNFFQRAVRSGKWVGMQELRSGQSLTLYDADADPGEKRAVTAKGDAAEAEKRLGAWLAQQLTSNLGEMPIGGDAD
jgi:choline-sulfatase